MIVTGGDFRVWLVNGARTLRYPVFGYRSVSVEGDKLGTGRCTVEFGTGRPAYSALIGAGGAGFEFFGASVDVYLGDMTTPLFSGPVLDARFVNAGSLASSRVVLQCESFLAHGLRRRQDVTSDYSAVNATGKPDDIARAICRACITGTPPAAYPLGVSRGNYQSWTYAIQPNTSSHPDTVTWKAQSGGSALDSFIRVCDQYDLAPSAPESPAATFTYTVAYPYQRHDRSAGIVLTAARAVTGGFELGVSYAELANVWQVAGQGKAATQVSAWRADLVSVAERGVCEDRLQVPAADNNSAADDEAKYMIAVRKNARLTYKVPIRQTTRARFNSDYGLRDLVTVGDPFFARSAAQQVVGYRVQVDGGGGVKVELLIQNEPYDPYRAMADVTGLPGGRTSGGRYVDKNVP